jgi:hypothetical protein
MSCLDSTLDTAKGLKPGSVCRLRGNDIMYCRIKRFLPKGLAECECSTSRDFSFGLLKTFRCSELRLDD